ncbi:MAG: hypothetical protein C0594_08695 [Marinilabiliales bacterium]|nr:MAG: hypothetical protein C0594_08695 [Marinilabiliales bacterium]
MKKKYIDFRKERHFGEVFTATFSFLNQNIKPLGKALMLYAGPFILMAGIATALVQSSVFDLQADLYQNNMGQYNDPFEWMYSFFFYYAFIMIFYVIGYTMIIGVLYSYITLYVEEGMDNFTLDDVRKRAFSNFFKIIGTNLVIGFIIALGFVMCCVPGIYLSTSLSLILIIIFSERKGFGDAFSRSFRITKKQWWWTLLLIIVTNGIIGAVSYVLSLPQAIISGIITFSSLDGGINSTTQIVYMFLSVLQAFLNSLLYIVPFTSYAFHYYSLVEKTESPALLEKINNIGTEDE